MGGLPELVLIWQEAYIVKVDIVGVDIVGADILVGYSQFNNGWGGQSIARNLDPGNSRENKVHFFSLDLEKLICISRSHLET